MGRFSGIKSLPGGNPQGTILAFLLFIVLINDLGFEGQRYNAGELITSKRKMKIVNEIHLKYVDDLNLEEAVNLIEVPDRARPDSYHARTGHALPVEKSRVYERILRTSEYARKNDMRINFNKTKGITFNPCTSIDFMSDMQFKNNDLEFVNEIKLLGLTIRSDIKWTSNTQNMIVKANKKFWILRRLKSFGAKEIDLVDVYSKQISCILELAERNALERVQKCACYIIVGNQYFS